MTGKALAQKVLKQLQHGMHMADSCYCGFCHARVGNVLPCNDKHHKEYCVVHELRKAAK